MADTKITGLQPPQPGYAIVPSTDVLPIVVIADPGMAASGSTRKATVNQILGAGGTATLASATITGAATVGTTLGVTGVSSFAAGTAALPALTRTGDTNTGIYYPAADTVAVTTAGTERVRVNSSGQIGFGVVPEAWSGDFKALQLGYPNFIAGNDGAYRVDVGVNAYYDGGYRYAASSVAASLYTQASGAHSWSTKAAGTAGNLVSFTPVMSLDASGNLTVANGNVILGTSGKGIDFSATASGSGTMTSELLNDYEEGTWTIGLTFGGGNTGLTTALNTGRYTKVGRQVTVCGRLELSNKGSSTGAAAITGLPFSIASGNDSQQAASFRFNGVSYTGAFQGYGALSSTSINLEQISEAGSPTDITDSNFSNGTSIQISFTYTI